MFTALSEQLTGVLSRLRGRGVLSESDVTDALREIRRHLLEADVSFEVTRGFVERVRELAVGELQVKAVSPGQQVVKLVHDEIATLLGGTRSGLEFASVSPTVILLVGLQGSGKTTTAAKLARRLKLEQKAPALVAADIYRPAAVEQLRQLGEQVGEKTDALEPFDPVRMAGRILGQGDVVALVEKAAANVDADAAKRLEQKVRSKKGMDLQDFLVALKQMQSMGPLKQVLGLLPGINAKALQGVSMDDKRLKHVEAIALSMTPAERADPGVLNGNRKLRIAKGAGRPVQEVNRLLEQFQQLRKMGKFLKGM